MTSIKEIFSTAAVPAKRISSTIRRNPIHIGHSPLPKPRKTLNKITSGKHVSKTSTNKTTNDKLKDKILLPFAHAPDGAEFHRKRQSFVQCRNQSSQTEPDPENIIINCDGQNDVSNSNGLELQLESKLLINNEADGKTERSEQTTRTKKKASKLFRKIVKETIPIDPDCPPGHVAMTEDDRVKMLEELKESYNHNLKELNSLPICIDTLRVRTKRIGLEKQLQQIEANIKIFSKPKVYIKTDNVT